MVRINVLNDALRNMVNAERKGKRQVRIHTYTHTHTYTEAWAETSKNKEYRGKHTQTTTWWEGDEKGGYENKAYKDLTLDELYGGIKGNRKRVFGP